MITTFNPTEFFDLTNFSYRDIFNNLEFAWEALPKIIPYIEEQLKTGKLTPNYKDRKDVFLGENVIIDPGVEIIGPAIIGKNTTIGHVSFIRGGCIIGENVHLGHAVELKHSIILNDATLAHLNYVGDSIIGNNTNISGGAMAANFRLDKQPVAVRTEKEKINTGLSKFGLILGDESRIGVNVVTNPGTILGKKVIVYPLKSVSGVHDHEAIIK